MFTHMAQRSHEPGERWSLESQGVRVLAVYARDGFHLSVSDPNWQFGVVAQHPDAIADLNLALPIARALIEAHLQGKRHAVVDSRELFQTIWTRSR
jgi:hypothetical protein